MKPIKFNANPIDFWSTGPHPDYNAMIADIQSNAPIYSGVGWILDFQSVCFYDGVAPQFYGLLIYTTVPNPEQYKVI